MPVYHHVQKALLMTVRNQHFVTGKNPFTTKLQGTHFLLPNIGTQTFRREIIPGFFNIFTVEQFHAWCESS